MCLVQHENPLLRSKWKIDAWVGHQWSLPKWRMLPYMDMDVGGHPHVDPRLNEDLMPLHFYTSAPAWRLFCPFYMTLPFFETQLTWNFEKNLPYPPATAPPLTFCFSYCSAFPIPCNSVFTELVRVRTRIRTHPCAILSASHLFIPIISLFFSLHLSHSPFSIFFFFPFLCLFLVAAGGIEGRSSLSTDVL